MTDEQKLFLAAYPLFPVSLVEKFSGLLSFELAKFNPELNKSVVDAYTALAAPILSTRAQNDSFSIYSPPGRYSTRADFSFSAQAYFHVSEFGTYSNSYSVPCSYVLYYDKRLFSSLIASLNVENVRTGETGYTNNPDYIPPRRDIFSYSPGVGNPAMVIYFLSPVFKVTVNPFLNGYNGAETALAMVENGVTVNVDYNMLKQFVLFINGYKKYSGQLSAFMSLQAEKAKQEMAQYKNALSDRLAARKNELNDLRTQIAFAAQNETNSAKRDMQNLALNAQSLILQLQEKIQ